MSILVDTNVLLRIAQVASPEHASAKAAVIALVDAGRTLCVVPQVIYEYWVVATRPVDVNGLGMDIATAETAVSAIMQDFQLLKDERGIFSHWRSLVVSHAVRGKTSHDTRLVAAMQRHGITSLLTFNTGDFNRFASIRAYSPAEVVAGTAAP